VTSLKLEHLFDEGDELVCSIHPSERVRLCAAEKNGNWVVRLVRHYAPYRSGRSPDWLKMKNPDAPAVKREAEEDWGRERWRRC
jgi:hypothetical protein